MKTTGNSYWITLVQELTVAVFQVYLEAKDLTPMGDLTMLIHLVLGGHQRLLILVKVILGF